MNLQNKKCLLAYYSRKGNNYVSGEIVNLPVGNTKSAADMIQKLTGADMFEINTRKDYPKDYKETTDIAMDELKNNARPELAAKVSDMEKYHIVFLGYPNWWGTMPMAVWTFLESYDFTGKFIVPFCTNEGSSMGRSEEDIRKLCPTAKLLPGLSIRGGQVKEAGKDIKHWLKNLN